MSDSRLKAAREAVKLNDPEIKINSVWVAKNHDGTPLRRVRVLALYPALPHDQMDERYWLLEELPGAMMRVSSNGYIRKCPEFNLRYVFEPEVNDEAS